MRIISENARVSSVGPGVEAIDAEIEIEEYLDSRISTVFVHVNALDGKVYTVSEQSLYSAENDISFSEEYNSLESAKQSPYYKCFQIADRMIEEMSEMSVDDI